MALARVVSVDGVDSDRMAQMRQEMEQEERPEEIPATEVIILHDPDSAQSLAIVFFDNEDNSARAPPPPRRSRPPTPRGSGPPPPSTTSRSAWRTSSAVSTASPNEAGVRAADPP